MNNNLLGKYLQTIEQERVPSVIQAARQLEADGWDIEFYDLQGKVRACYFSKNGAVVMVMALPRRTRKSWVRWLLS